MPGPIFDEANYPEKESQYLVFEWDNRHKEWQRFAILRTSDEIPRYMKAVKKAWPFGNFVVVKETLTRKIIRGLVQR